MSPRQYQETMPRIARELGSRLLLNLTPANPHKPTILQGEFVGAAHYEFLIVRLPTIPGLARMIVPHVNIEVSYQDSGASCRFMTEVVGHTAKPAFLLYLSYPDRVRVAASREHQRCFCALPARLASPKGEAQAVITDLSLGGCRLSLELTGQSGIRELTDGDIIVLQTCFSADGEAVRGVGVVRALEITGSKMHMGVAFDEGHKDFFSALQRYLDAVCAIL